MDYKTIEKAYNNIKSRMPYIPQLAVIMGSGLGEYADGLNIISAIPYSSIDGFPVSTVSGHKGRFVFAEVEGVRVVFMQGRVHYYEGYSMEHVVMPVRLMRLMGAEKLFVTNAAGGINPIFKAGTFMIIKDHIMMAPNPLIGENYSGFGTRFPDMSEAYDKKLISALTVSATEAGTQAEQGVYIQLTGPSFETPAEVRMCSRLGADAVGMSTACEVIAGNHAGMRVCGLSVISNAAAGVSDKKLSHEDVNETTEKIRGVFSSLMNRAIKNVAAN